MTKPNKRQSLIGYVGKNWKLVWKINDSGLKIASVTYDFNNEIFMGGKNWTDKPSRVRITVEEI